jgi:sarcosine oxidase
MNTRLHVLIIGGGVMGCATAYAAARAGHRVTLIEQFKIGHVFGSSHGPSRIIRLAYDGADYVAMARASYDAWRALEAEAGVPLLEVIGGFDIGVPGTEAIAGIRNTYLQTGVPFEEMTGAQFMARFPQLRVPENMDVLYQPDYGLLYADACVATFAAQAHKHGAVFAQDERVVEIQPDGERVHIRTAQKSYTADRVVICAGSWMNKVLAPLGVQIPLKTTKEMGVYYQPPNPQDFAIGRFPLFLQRFPGSTVVGNTFPIFGSPYVKGIFDRNNVEIDPDDTDLTPNPEALAKLKAYIASRLPTLGDDVVEVVTCRYTLTPDEHFVLDRHPRFSNIIIGSPCSGHGFKFAPVIGQILADLATLGTTRFDISRFRLDRPALTQ